MTAPIEWKRFFWRWVLGFAVLGLLIPVTLMIRPFLFGQPFGAWSVRLWPSSLFFAALDEPWPSPMGTAAVLYGLALIINVLLYSCLGVVLWPFADLLVGRLNSRANQISGNRR